MCRPLIRDIKNTIEDVKEAKIRKQRTNLMDSKMSPQKRYRIQKKAEIVFVLSNGWPECQVCGKKLPSNQTNPENEAGMTIHHKIQLHTLGIKRPNGNKARILEWARNMWNITVLCPECHKKAHEGEKAHKMINSTQNSMSFV